MFVCMTTIPSRFHNPEFQTIINTLKQQTHKDMTIVIFIPKSYRRQFHHTITEVDINNFRQRHRRTNPDEIEVKVVSLDQDYGPATKYMGPLISDVIPEAGTVIIIDDDCFYSPYLVEHFVYAFNKHQCDVVATSKVWKSTTNHQYLKKVKSTIQTHVPLMGVLGYAFKKNTCCTLLKQFTAKILVDYPDCVIHDDAIISQYMMVYKSVVCVIKHIVFMRATNVEINRLDGLYFQPGVIRKRAAIEKTLANRFKKVTDIDLFVSSH